ncbi:MAG: MprA protease, GlyGly-CTERM protein-sorting domain-containing form [Verrucomicrobiota bacterium]
MIGLRFRSFVFSVGLAMAIIVGAGTSQAATLIFNYSGIASGSLGGTNFTDQAFTLSVTVDTVDRSAFASGFRYNNVTPQASIAGFGVVTFSGSFAIVINNNTNWTGIANDGRGLDAVSSFNPVFATYDGLSPLGPVLANGFISGGAYPISTSGGSLSFDAALNTPITVEVIPEPSCAALLMVGLAGFVRRRRR